MVRIFRKRDEKKSISDDEKDRLIKKAYELGFEVGYHRHSEIGWVNQSLVTLYNFSREYGLEEIVRDSYHGGKKKGSAIRERDLKKDLSPTRVSQYENIHVSGIINPSGISSGYSKQHKTIHSKSPVNRPTMMNLPENTSIVGMIQRPSQIKGFFPLIHEEEDTESHSGNP